MISQAHLILLVAVILFSVGTVTFLTKRNAVVALMGIELMLNGINLVLLQAGQLHGNAEGSSLMLFVVLVAAAEAALALSIFVILFRKNGMLILENYRSMKG
ncbi:MAG: NADH-quinone oxidoreductase subunit NuoK [Bdellovibrionota bacterium]